MSEGFLTEEFNEFRNKIEKEICVFRDDEVYFRNEISSVRREYLKLKNAIDTVEVVVNEQKRSLKSLYYSFAVVLTINIITIFYLLD